MKKKPQGIASQWTCFLEASILKKKISEKRVMENFIGVFEFTAEVQEALWRCH